LIVRDLDVLRRLHEEASVCAYFSIPFADHETARKVEPQAPSIGKRFEAMRLLSEAGIPTGISIAPVIPGLNEDDIPELLQRARDAGASDAAFVLLRLSGNVAPVFLERMAAAFPDRVDKITHRLREVRNGKLSESGFFKRYEGHGAHWQLVEQLFEVARRKAGFPEKVDRLVPKTFRRPTPQMTLF
jgi:DNA repair photolyase